MIRTGWYLILNREEAKQLFAAREDTAVRDVVENLLKRRTAQKDDTTLDCGGLWDPIHRSLTDGTLDPEGGRFPINHCVLGGKQLFKGDAFEVVVVRPDIVPHVAEAIHGLKRVEVQENYRSISADDYGKQPTDEEFDLVWNMLSQVRILFEDAADNRDAILFAVSREAE